MTRFKILLISCMALLAFSAVAAASASALTWYSKSPETAFKEGQEETVTPAIKSGTEFVLTGKVGTTPITLKAKKLSGEATTIKQSGTTAADSGKLVFSELTLTEPATCTPPTSITTSTLKSELVEVAGLTSGLADRFRPETGEVFASFKLGGSCAIAKTVIQVKTKETKGVYAETEPKGTFKVEQPLKFSSSINATAGGELRTGENAATLTGEGINKLSGTLVGKEWAAK